MTEIVLLDVLLLITLLGYIGYGFSHGLSRTVFVIAGVVLGVIAAFFAAPVVATWVPWPAVRALATILAAVGLIVVGHALGSSLGRAIRSGIEKGALSALDRILGGIVAGVTAALVASMVAFSVGQLGVPLLSRAIAGSAVLRVVGSLTPDPVESWLAQLRGVVVARGLPIITGVLPGSAAPAIPQVDTGSVALNRAAQSVVRITGNAYACGVAQAGSGFVVADDRVVTNAHVVAGVTEPVIESPGGETLSGSVVFFDPELDLAVILVPGLSAATLPLGDTLTAGTDAAVQGYPYGGPFSARAASVVAVGTTPIMDIYGVSSHPREIYSLAADVREGNSGGPLLSLSGEVVGVIFARSADSETVGYAVTMAELDPVAQIAAQLELAVSTGDCISG